MAKSSFEIKYFEVEFFFCFHIPWTPYKLKGINTKSLYIFNLLYFYHILNNHVFNMSTCTLQAQSRFFLKKENPFDNINCLALLIRYFFSSVYDYFPSQNPKTVHIYESLSLSPMWVMDSCTWPCLCPLVLWINDRGEPAVSYKWTGWVWEITGWSWRLQENYRSF